MKPKIRVLTLAVADLEASLKFYRDGLGLPTVGIVGTEFEDGAVALFNLDDAFMLALFPRESMAKDSNLPPGSTNPTDFSIGHNVDSRDEVDVVMAEAERAGARISVAARDTYWGGYSGYFQDPDGHLWEVIWNPDLV